MNTDKAYTEWLADCILHEANLRKGDTKELLLVAMDAILEGSTPPTRDWGFQAWIAWRNARMRILDMELSAYPFLNADDYERITDMMQERDCRD